MNIPNSSHVSLMQIIKIHVAVLFIMDVARFLEQLLSRHRRQVPLLKIKLPDSAAIADIQNLPIEFDH